MKKVYLALTAIWSICSLCILSGCNNSNDFINDKIENISSLDSPETIAYLHNAALTTFFNANTTKADDGNLPSDFINQIANIVVQEAQKIGIETNITEDNIVYVSNSITELNVKLNTSLEETIKYYTQILPLPDDVKDNIYAYSISDIKNGTSTTLDYINSLSAEKQTKSSYNYALHKFSAVGNASYQFWTSFNTTKAKMTSRDWLGCMADIAGSFLAGGLVGIMVSTCWSLNASFVEPMSLEDSMNTNCD